MSILLYEDLVTSIICILGSPTRSCVPWIATSAVLASLLIVSWGVFIASCVVTACRGNQRKRHLQSLKSTYDSVVKLLITFL